MYIHTYIHTYIRKYAHAYIHVPTYVQAYKQMYIYTLDNIIINNTIVLCIGTIKKSGS